MMFVRHGPLWFRMVAIALVLWGLMGCFSCIQQIRLGAEAMGPASAYDRALYAALPRWYDPLYGVAVGTGLIGAVLLFMRRAIARTFFLVSLLAIVAMFGWIFVMTDLIAHKGPAAALSFPLVITAIAIFSIWLAGHARRRGWTG